MPPSEKWTSLEVIPRRTTAGHLGCPYRAGCYHLRRRDTGELVLFGQARNVARRMSSLLPYRAGGGGHRSNTRKRRYVKAHLEEIEYHTCACDNVKQARELESHLRRRMHIFHT